MYTAVDLPELFNGLFPPYGISLISNRKNVRAKFFVTFLIMKHVDSFIGYSIYCISWYASIYFRYRLVFANNLSDYLIGRGKQNSIKFISGH